MNQIARPNNGMQFDDAEINREHFATYADDEQVQAAARHIAEQRGWPTGNIRKGGLTTALRLLGVAPPPRFMIVDIDGVEDIDLESGLLELTRLGSSVVAIGNFNDVNHFRTILRAGVRDYLVKPVDTDQLAEAFVRLEKSLDGDDTKGRVTSVIGSRGGVGVSTVAINAAWIMAERLSRRTALVDMDLYAGTIALALDIEPTRGLREVFDDPERVDEVFLQNAMTKLGKSLHVLATEEAFDDTVAMTDDKILTIADTMRANFDMSILDLPRHFVMREPQLFTRCDDIVIVSTLTLQCLRDVNRLVRLLETRNSRAKIHVVANRAGAKPDVTVQEFEEGMEAKLSCVFGDDPKAMNRASLSGQPLAAAEPKHRMIQDLHKLCIEIAGVLETTETRRGLFGRRRR